MKAIKNLCLVLATGVSLNGFSQSHFHERVTYSEKFPWEAGQTKINADQQKLADSLYTVLAPGESIRLDLLSEEEKQLGPTERSKLSYLRAYALIQYCTSKKFPLKEYYAEVVPYYMPHTVRTNDFSSARYRGLAQRSQSWFVFMRNKTEATSKAAANFDASIDKEKEVFLSRHKQPINIFLASGTQIYIPANSLQYKNGRIPSCEEVTVTVAEYVELEAMAIKAMTTSSSGKKLRTSGMWYIQVTCNGEPLVMKPGQFYHINVAKHNDVEGMKVFTGQMKGKMLDWHEETDGKVTSGTSSIGETMNAQRVDSTYAEPELDAEEEYSGSVWNNAVFDDSERFSAGVIESGGQRYDLELNDFGWINCDAFDETQQLTEMMVMGDIKEGTSVMLVYAKRKSVLPGYLCEDGKTVKFSDIAADEPAVLVVFTADKDKKVVAFTKLVQPGAQKTVMANTTTTTLEDLRADIKTKLSDL